MALLYTFHFTQKTRIFARPPGYIAAQPGGKPPVAVNRAEIEENIRQPQGIRIRLAEPAVDLLVPLDDVFAPQRIGCHYVSLAGTDADLIKRACHAFGKLDKPAVNRRVPWVRVFLEDKTVILVRNQKTFVSAA